MSYALSQKIELTEYFINIFGISPGGFINKVMSSMRLQWCIDIEIFDDYIRKMHGDYETEGKSLSYVIFDNYGDEGAALIDELI